MPYNLRSKRKTTSYFESDEVGDELTQNISLYPHLKSVRLENNKNEIRDLAVEEGVEEITIRVDAYRDVDGQDQFLIETIDPGTGVAYPKRWEIASHCGSANVAHFIARNEDGFPKKTLYRDIAQEYKTPQIQLYDVGLHIEHTATIAGRKIKLSAQIAEFYSRRVWSVLRNKCYRIEYLKADDELPESLSRFRGQIAGGWISEQSVILPGGREEFIVGLHICRQLYKLAMTKKILPPKKVHGTSQTNPFWQSPVVIENSLSPYLENNMSGRVTRGDYVVWQVQTDEEFKSVFVCGNRSISYTGGTSKITVEPDCPLEIMWNKKARTIKLRFFTEWDSNVA